MGNKSVTTGSFSIQTKNEPTRHLNPVIVDTLAVALAVVLAAAMIYGMFTCHLANYPELGAINLW